jgi:hypothetical protein
LKLRNCLYKDYVVLDPFLETGLFYGYWNDSSLFNESVRKIW